MKRIIAIALLFAVLTLAACGQTNPAAEKTQNGGAIQIPNPWRDITEAEAKELCPKTFAVPTGAGNVQWSVMESATENPLLQLSFDWNGLSFTAREQVTDDKAADLSGMYYDWTAQEDSTLQDRAGNGIPCKTYRYIGKDDTADLCTWYDTDTGIACSLGVTAKDLDGFDLRAVAEAVLPVSLPALEEQRSILEANRALWAFDEGAYAPEWSYTFTDLDHNGLLEVISASTQGSGIFTYAHFYEVLPDGSGVRNLYHADAEIEGPDDWPEIILDAIPCYYDRAADRYYYVCSNVIRDGAAHSMTQIAALCLQYGVAEWEYLASMDVQMTESGEQVSYTDGAGNPISEQDYHSAVERRFAGLEQSDLKPEWITVKP